MSVMLATDAYKFAMAQAGFPLRKETFYLSFRRGGWQHVPLDLTAWVRARVAEITAAYHPDAAKFAATHGYALSEAMRTALADVALADSIEIDAVPPNTWVFEREPILTITGPSFLVSFLEPRLLWLNYPIQLATAVLRDGRRDDGTFGTATCEEHRDIVTRTLTPLLGHEPSIRVNRERYLERVEQRVTGLVRAVGGDPDRIFEVGMRSAVCMDQHRVALEACKAAGVDATSNVMLAHELGMNPVGTMGHEHVQRHGDDLTAFRAMRDRRDGVPSYLLDTFDTIGSGLPAARTVMEEHAHRCSVRYDSGDKVAQYRFACEMFATAGLAPTHVLEDGFDLAMTEQFEALRGETGLPPERQVYGYGGYIVAGTANNEFTRDRVSAVYKLSATGGEARMKFGDEDGLGKTSVPGRPVTWRRVRGDGPLGIIGQKDEPVHGDYVCLSESGEARSILPSGPAEFTPSPETKHLMRSLTRGEEKLTCPSPTTKP
jgi:nicotinate phosphoribosyltransferase